MRDDSGAYGGWTVPTAYDPLISKVIVWAPDRQRAIARMVRALTEYDIRGIRTTVGFCRELIESQQFAAGEFDTTSVDRVVERRGRSATAREEMAEEIAAISTAIFESTRDEGETKRPERPVIRAESLWAQRARLEGLR